MNEGKSSTHNLKLGICLLGAVVVALGLTVLAGWYSHNEALIQVRPQFVPMQYNTALGFIFIGAALLAAVCGLPRMAHACSVFVVCLGIATLFEYIFSVDLGIDQLLMEHYITILSPDPGRMAPTTALCFTLAGAAIALPSRWHQWFTEFCAIAGSLVLGIGSIAIIGYAAGLELVYDWGEITRLAAHTALGFMLAGTALLLLSWRVELEIGSDSPNWLPVPIGIASLVFTLSFWLALDPSQSLETANIAHSFLLIGGITLSAMLASLVYFSQRAHKNRSLAESSLRALVLENELRANTEQQLKTAQERWQFALEGNRDGVWDWNLESNEVYYSRRWKQILGFEEDEIANTVDEWRERIHPDDKEQVLVDLNRHFDRETAYYENEHRVRCKDGSYNWVLTRGQVIAWAEDGKPRRIIGTHSDIEQRKKNEESLYQAQNIVNHNSDMLALLDKDLYYQQVNTAYAQAFGKTPAEFIGRTPADVFGKELFETVIEPHAKLCLKGEFVRYQSWMQFPDLGKRYMDISYSPHENSIGELKGFIVSGRDITARKELIQSLQESESRWKTLTENSPDHIMLLDTDFVIQYINRTVPDLTADQVIGTLVLDYVPPEDRDAVIECFERVLQSKKLDSYETRYISNAGQVHHFRVRISPLLNKEGEVTNFISSSYDITEKKNLSLSIRRTRLLLEQTSQLAKIGGWELDALTNKLSWTTECYHIHELPFEQEPSLDKAIEFYHPDDRPALELAIQRALEQGESFDLELRLITAKGKHLWVRSIAEIITKDGKVIRVTGVIQDITESKRAKSALRSGAVSLHTFYETIPDLAWSKDLDGVYLSCNTKFEELVGASAADIVGKTDYEFFDKEQADLFRENDLAALKLGKSNSNEEELTFASDGHTELVETIKTPMLNAAGEPFGILGIARDITERTRLQSILLESEERFSSIATSSNDAIIMLGEESRVSFWNSAAEKIFGYSEKESVGRKIEELIIPEKLIDAHRKGYAEFRSSGKGLLIGKTIELEARRKDGSGFEIEMSISTTMLQGQQVAIGIIRDISARKQLENNLQRFDRALKTLVNVNQTIIKAKSEQYLLNSICRALIETGGYKLAWIGFIEHDERKSVRSVAKFGFDEGYIDSLNISWANVSTGQGPTGSAIRNNEIVVSQSILNDPNFGPWHEKTIESGFQSSIAIPLAIDNKAIGVISIYSADADAFDEQEVKLLGELAADLSFGIQSQRLKASSEDYARQLSASLSQTVEAIALTVETRDPYTAGHMNRVAELSVAIAKEMGLAEHRIEGIQFGASIHDLGKIYVPGEILNRPGKLTAAEFDIIKSHPQIGYDIIKGIEFPWPVAEMVIQHHERLDGKGYPNGLQGEEIILESRILSVADVVEAVSSHRPYRPAKTIEVGLEIIEKGKGTMFDADVVKACTKIIKEDGFKFSSSF